MSVMVARHKGSDPNDDDAIDQWHVGRSFLGMFPTYEASCPCPKAPCGLAAPVADIPCEHHHGEQALRQAHRVDDCAAYRRARRKRLMR